MSSLSSILQALKDSDLATYFRESAYGFPIAESVHVVAIVLVVGTVAVVDLRLLNVASRNAAVTRLAKDILPWTWGAFAMAFVAGFLMFITKPDSYLANWPFRLKFMAMALAAANMVVFEFITMRGVKAWDLGRRPPAAAIAAGALSLFFWALVVVFGRWIGFTLS